jgi:hypothetical protein
MGAIAGMTRPYRAMLAPGIWVVSVPERPHL